MGHVTYPAASVCLLIGAIGLAQTYPGQYPPSQYPTGQYPGQYPPGQYPPGTYPPTYPMPGGVPIQLPVPEIKLPKRQPKDSKTSEQKTTVAAVSGVLRKLEEKTLLLQTNPKTVLRFRLLVKTEFRNTDGRPIRDSLLHPGDQLSVEVSPDDEETALNVVLVRSGAESARRDAEQAVNESLVRAPRSEDLGKARTVSAPASPAEANPSVPADAPGTPGAAAPDAASSPSEPPAPRKPLPRTDAEIIAEVRAASESFTSSLPSYLVEQVTTRSFGTGFTASSWQKIDVVTANLAYVDGREDYRDFKINGIPTDAPPERTGSWTTGEFSTTLEDILSIATAANFKRRGEDKTAGRRALVFNYTVEQPRSHWTMVAPDGRRYNPAYDGAIWVDMDTRRVLRIEQRATSFPADFPFSRMECILDYGFERIERGTYLLPAGSVNTACARGSGTCTRNEIQFRNYRKFTAESTVKF